MLVTPSDLHGNVTVRSLRGVEFVGSLGHTGILSELKRATAALNMSATESVDEAVLEAKAHL